MSMVEPRTRGSIAAAWSILHSRMREYRYPAPASCNIANQTEFILQAFFREIWFSSNSNGETRFPMLAFISATSVLSMHHEQEKMSNTPPSTTASGTQDSPGRVASKDQDLKTPPLPTSSNKVKTILRYLIVHHFSNRRFRAHPLSPHS